MYDPALNQMIDLEYLDGMDLSAEMDKAVTDARTAEREQCERNWNINLAWYMGQPWWRTGFNGDLEVIEPEFRKDYFHVNIMAPRVQTLVGNELYIPKFEARPSASHQLEDVMRARAAADVANHAVSVSDCGSAIRDGHHFKHIFGLVWFEVGWDQEAGPSAMAYDSVPCEMCQGAGAIITPETPDGISPCPVCGAQGIVMGRPDLNAPTAGYILKEKGEEPQGDLAVYTRPPWEVYFDPNQFDPFKARWLVHDADMDKTVAFNLFCKDTGIAPEDLMESSPDDALDRSMVTKLPLANKQGQNRKEMVRVRRYYHLRTTKHPRGLYGVKVGGKLAISGPLPYAHRKIPFIPLRGYTAPMKMYPVSTCDRLMSTAIFINEMMTKMYQRASQSVQLRILAARGSAIDMSDIMGVLEYDPKRGIAPPQPFNDGGASPDAANIVAQLKEYADEISFVQDVLRGESSGSQDNARFSALREQRAMNPLKMMVEDNSKTFSLLGKLLVDTAKLFYSPARTIRSVYGSRGHAKISSFGSTPIGSVDDFEIMAVRDIGRSLASRREELYEAKRSGVIDDPKLAKLAEFATDDGPWDDTEVHETACMIEGDKIRSGQPIDPAQEYEDHSIHIPNHQMLLAELRTTLGSQHPQVLALQAHIQSHMQMQAKEQYEQQMYMQQAAQQYGLANAGNGQNQPQSSQAAAQAGGGASANPSSAPVQPGDPSPPETQPALAQVDQQLKPLDQALSAPTVIQQ